MKRAATIAGIALAAAAVAASLPDEAPDEIASIQCEYHVAARRVAAGKIIAFYVPPAKYRIEVPGGLVFLGDGTSAYKYSPRSSSAIQFPADEPLFAPVNPAFLDLVKKASRKVGREELHGKPCDVYVLEKSLKAPGSGLGYGTPGTKIWIWEKGRVVLKTQFGTSPGSFSYICAEVKFNSNIPESKFRLPLGTLVKAYAPPPRAGDGSR